MICDTSGLIAAMVSGQPEHDESLDAMNRADSLILSPFSLSEVDFLVTARHGVRTAQRILKHLAAPEFELAAISHSDMAQALDVMATYEDLDIGLTDASLVVLAKRYNTNEILTLDQRRFRAMRSLSGRPFKIFPYDAD